MRIGIDVGGTKIEAAAFARDGAEVFRRRVPTPRGEYEGAVNAIAGEWGHNPLPWPTDDERPGPPCYCGHRGCVETFLSGPGMSSHHRLATGETREPFEISAQAAAGDPAARATLDRYADRMAR